MFRFFFFNKINFLVLLGLLVSFQKHVFEREPKETDYLRQQSCLKALKFGFLLKNIPPFLVFSPFRQSTHLSFVLVWIAYAAGCQVEVLPSLYICFSL